MQKKECCDLKTVKSAFYQQLGIEIHESHDSYRDLQEMRCEVYNDSVGTLTGYNCEKCKNRGYFAKVNNNGDEVREECTCMAIRKAERLMANSGMKGLLERCTFDTFCVYAPWMGAAKQVAQRYADGDSNAWLLISGQSGAGKTHLCTAVCRRLMERGYSVQYRIWGSLLQKFESARFNEDKTDALMHDLAEPDVLYIDDFLKVPNGKHKSAVPSDTALHYALEAVNVRYNSRKRTIISTEFYAKDITEMDTALGGRIDEMSRGCKIQIVADDSRNFRTNRYEHE